MNNNLLHFIAILFLVIWIVAYFGYDANGIIHILLIVAIIIVLLRVIGGGNRYRKV